VIGIRSHLTTPHRRSKLDHERFDMPQSSTSASRPIKSNSLIPLAKVPANYNRWPHLAADGSNGQPLCETRY
jgi:hypothetical protein